MYLDVERPDLPSCLFVFGLSESEESCLLSILENSQDYFCKYCLFPILSLLSFLTPIGYVLDRLTLFSFIFSTSVFELPLALILCSALYNLLFILSLEFLISMIII